MRLRVFLVCLVLLFPLASGFLFDTKQYPVIIRKPPSDLNSLSDVNYNNPVSGDLFVWDGNTFVVDQNLVGENYNFSSGFTVADGVANNGLSVGVGSDGNMALSVHTINVTDLVALSIYDYNAFGDIACYLSGACDLGVLGGEFNDLFLLGDLSDGNASLTIVNARTAYDHSQTTTGNPHDLQALDIESEYLAGSTYSSLQDFINFQSAGWISGGIMTSNGDGTVTVASGTGMIKTTDSETGTNIFFDWAQDNSVSLSDDQLNYVYADYSGGSPTITSTTDFTSIDKHTQIFLGIVFRKGNSVEIINDDGYKLPDLQARRWERLRYRSIERMTGGEISATGTRNIASTGGVFYIADAKVVTSAKDTATGDSFFTYFYDGSNWVSADGNTQIDNLYYNDTGSGLVELGTGKYGVHWVFVCMEGDLYVLYGQDSYNLAQAENASLPASLPNYLNDFSVLAAKIIIKKNESSFTGVESAFEIVFPRSTVTVHNDLSSLQGGVSGEYYHLSSGAYGYLLGQDQNVSSGASPSFGDVTVSSVTDGTATLIRGALAGLVGPLAFTQNSDTVTLSHDGTDAYYKWSDGALNLQTDEGTNTTTNVYVKGKGSNIGNIRIYDEDESVNLRLFAQGDEGKIEANGALVLQEAGVSDVYLFPTSTEGTTRDFRVYGYRTGDALRSLQVDVGSVAADTASFAGVSNYWFDGAISGATLTDGTATLANGDLNAVDGNFAGQISAQDIDVAGNVDAGNIDVTTDLNVSGDIAGTRHTLASSWDANQTVSAGGATAKYGEVRMKQNEKGFVPTRNGSIVGISASYDVTVSSSPDLEFAFAINNTSYTPINVPDTVADNHTAYNTFSRGTYAFSAGDVIVWSLAETSGGSATVNDMTVSLEIVYDS